MKLSDLNIEQKARVVKVGGNPDFKKRVSELGFVKGEEVRLVKAAPFKGPAEFEILGYKVSLRKEEAGLIEVIPRETPGLNGIKVAMRNGQPLKAEKQNNKTIKVAFVGNPNSGKTSLFNKLSHSREKVGNYGGVTIEKKTARIEREGYSLEMIDLPGTYSLSEYTPEEKYVREFLLKEKPDLVVNIVDSTNLKRNLYLTTQLMDLGCRVIIALNMFDEIRKEGIKLIPEKLEEKLGIKTIPTIGTQGVGIGDLLDEIVRQAGNQNGRAGMYIHYGDDIESAMDTASATINGDHPEFKLNRYFLLKTLKNEQSFVREYLPHVPVERWAGLKEKVRQIEEKYGDDIDTLITNSRYLVIDNIVTGCMDRQPRQTQLVSEKVDKILLHKFFGMPIFLAFMFLTFWVTFELGSYPTHWIELGFDALGNLARLIIPAGIAQDLVVDGIITGIGGVLVFLPNILILFLFISFMEDSGYMARASFIMDNMMHKIGLHGRSFIPLIIGFGCNVPAIMSTRTIRDRKDRLMTMLMIPFMSCSARLPVYVLITSAFFPKYPALFIFGLYLLGILLSIVMAKFLNITLFRKKLSLLMMELPPYRLPGAKTVVLNMWFKGSQYLRKIGKIILIASVIIWVLNYFPVSRDENTTIQDSYINQIGEFVLPVMHPLGFDWKMTVGLISGFAAKEVIISTMNIIYETGNGDLKSALIADNHFNTANALSFLVFILIYLPCISVISTLAKEGGWKIAWISVVFNTTVAWIVSFAIYQLVSVITGI